MWPRRARRLVNDPNSSQTAGPGCQIPRHVEHRFAVFARRGQHSNEDAVDRLVHLQLDACGLRAAASDEKHEACRNVEGGGRERARGSIALRRAWLATRSCVELEGSDPVLALLIRRPGPSQRRVVAQGRLIDERAAPPSTPTDCRFQNPRLFSSCCVLLPARAVAAAQRPALA